MNEPSERGYLTWIIILLVTTGLLALLVFSFFIIRNRTARLELNARLDRLITQEMPIDDESMLRYYHQLTSSDHTQAWLTALRKLTSQEFEQSTAGIVEFDPSVQGRIPGPHEPWMPTSTFTEDNATEVADTDEAAIDQQTTRAFLASTASLRSELSTLAKRHLEPNVKPVRLITSINSINTTLGTTQSMRDAARLLSIHGQVAIFDRDSAQVRDIIESLLGCSAALKGEPFLVSQLVVIAIESMAIELLRQSLEHRVLSESDLIALAPRFASRTEISPQWRIAMVGERGISLPVFANPDLVLGTDAPKIPIRARDALYFLDFMERAISMRTDNIDRFVTDLQAAKHTLEESSSSGMLRSLDTILTNLMAPSINATGNAFVRQSMQYRIATIGIGVRLFELQNGRLPSSISELGTLKVAGEKFDPLALSPPGGKPFGYQLKENQALLWGFDMFQNAATPDMPPIVTEGAPYAEQNKQWIWSLPSATPI